MKERKSKQTSLSRTKNCYFKRMEEESLKNFLKTCDDQQIIEYYSNIVPSENQNFDTTPWGIYLRENDSFIGIVGFGMTEQKRTIQLMPYILKEYEGNGYMTECCKRIIDWVFTMEDIYFIQKEVNEPDTTLEEMLTSLGFVLEETSHSYLLEKPLPSWIGIYMCFGLCIGMSFGNFYDKSTLGLSMGLCIGMAIGALLDSSENKKREVYRKERKGSEE